MDSRLLKDASKLSRSTVYEWSSTLPSEMWNGKKRYLQANKNDRRTIQFILYSGSANQTVWLSHSIHKRFQRLIAAARVAFSWTLLLHSSQRARWRSCKHLSNMVSYVLRFNPQHEDWWLRDVFASAKLFRPYFYRSSPISGKVQCACPCSLN